MKTYLLPVARFVLKRVLARQCEATIPRSGEKGARVNCFVVSIDKGDEPYLIALGLEEDTLSCIEWDGSKYQIERQVALAGFNLSDITVTHYYGLSTVRYGGVLDYLIDHTLAWPYLKIHAVSWLSSIDQYLFNKRKLVSKQRIDLLKLLVDLAMDGKHSHEAMDLMTALYTMKWFLHPQGEETHRRLEFFLEALVETGELRKVNHAFVVTGLALRAIEEYEEQERKHTENVKMQWRMFWLTLAIAVLTIVQAGLVKLPPLLDLTAK